MRNRIWPALALAMLAAAGLGSCAGAMIGHYTVTGMLPLGPSGSVPDYMAEVRARDAKASPIVEDDQSAQYASASYDIDGGGY